MLGGRFEQLFQFITRVGPWVIKMILRVETLINNFADHGIRASMGTEFGCTAWDWTEQREWYFGRAQDLFMIIDEAKKGQL